MSTLAAAAAAALLATLPLENALPPTAFVTRSGSFLISPSNTSFRFGGANLYWLGLDENEGGRGQPSHFRVLDGLTTAASLGITVIRSHTLGISTGSYYSFEPTLGVFNASALDAADFALASAQALGVRFIIPLTDNWKYYHGGRYDFTRWVGVGDNDFYTSEKAVTAFEAYITARLTHVNPYTGRAAKDEPAVLAC